MFPCRCSRPWPQDALPHYPVRPDGVCSLSPVWEPRVASGTDQQHGVVVQKLWQSLGYSGLPGLGNVARDRLEALKASRGERATQHAPSLQSHVPCPCAPDLIHATITLLPRRMDVRGQGHSPLMFPLLVPMRGGAARARFRGLTCARATVPGGPVPLCPPDATDSVEV